MFSINDSNGSNVSNGSKVRSAIDLRLPLAETAEASMSMEEGGEGRATGHHGKLMKQTIADVRYLTWLRKIIT